MKNHNTKKEETKLNLYTESGEPLQKLPLNLTLDVHHRLGGDLSEADKAYLIALDSAFYTEAIFWCLYQINEHGDFNSQNIDKDEMMVNLAFVCKIGMALASKAAEYIDIMEMALNSPETLDKNEELKELETLAAAAQLVVINKLSPENALLLMKNRGYPEIRLPDFQKFLREQGLHQKSKR